MNSSVKKILKRGTASGEEIGRLMIQDLVRSCSNTVKSKRNNDGLLTDEEKGSLVSMLNDPQDIKAYNDFRYVHEYLVHVPTLFMLNIQTAKTIYLQLDHIFTSLFDAEYINSCISLQPYILTKKQYNEQKIKDFDEKMNLKCTAEELILNSVEYYVDQYESGKKTIFNKYFNDAKKKPLTNYRIKNRPILDYEGMSPRGSYVLPDGRTNVSMTLEEWSNEVFNCMNQGQMPRWVANDEENLYSAIQTASFFYASWETNSKKTIFEFISDFPELYNALVDDLVEKGIDRDALNPQHIFDVEFSFSDLYSKKIPWVVEKVDFFKPKGTCGVAILDTDTTKLLTKAGQIDKDGDYYGSRHPYLFFAKRFMAETVLKERTEEIRHLLEEYMAALKLCFAIHTGVELIGEFIKVPDVTNLIGDVETAQIESLNSLMSIIPDMIYRYNTFEEERPAKELKKELEELLQPIEIELLKPTSAAIENARKNIDFTTIQGNAKKLYALLLSGGE